MIGFVLRLPILRLLLAAGLLAAALPASAAEMLTGEQIRAMIAGNTIAGTMAASGDYAEYYQADGVIKGDGYTGAWTIEGDAMCFQYGSDPKSCWTVGQNGDELQWFKDGAFDGTGMIQPGNPNNY